MKILVLNCGSSSVKYKLIDTANDNTLAEGGVEKIGLADAFIKFKLADGSKKIVELDITDHQGAIKAILDTITSEEFGCIKSFNEIDAVGRKRGAGIGGGHHGLKSGAGFKVLKTGFGVIRVFMDKGETGTLRKSADIRQLLLDGDITLAGGGVPRISDSSTRRAGGDSVLFHGSNQWKPRSGFPA